MNKYLIIVEGKADVVFLRDYLQFLDNNLIFKNKVDKKTNKKEIKSENIFESEDIQIKIFVANSYNGIPKLKPKIMPLVDSKVGYKLIIIQDADNPKTKRDGGKTLRLKYLDIHVRRKLNIEFETFLFPNHKDDGDLETLLLQIANIKNYDDFFQCHTKYKNDIHTIAPKFSNELDEDKYKVFHYFRTFYGSENSKEINRIYEKAYWDFNSEELKPLKDFFSKNLK